MKSVGNYLEEQILRTKFTYSSFREKQLERHIKWVVGKFYLYPRAFSDPDLIILLNCKPLSVSWVSSWSVIIKVLIDSFNSLIGEYLIPI